MISFYCRIFLLYLFTISINFKTLAVLHQIINTPQRTTKNSAQEPTQPFSLKEAFQLKGEQQ